MGQHRSLQRAAASSGARAAYHRPFYRGEPESADRTQGVAAQRQERSTALSVDAAKERRSASGRGSDREWIVSPVGRDAIERDSPARAGPRTRSRVADAFLARSPTALERKRRVPLFDTSRDCSESRFRDYTADRLATSPWDPPRCFF